MVRSAVRLVNKVALASVLAPVMALMAPPRWRC